VANAGPRPRRQRGSITPEEILDGAFAVARRDGLDNLSMPELAAHLGVGVTSIYWYYRRKEDLLRKMNETAVKAIQDTLPVVEGTEASEWRSFLSNYFHSQRKLYGADDLFTDLILIRTSSYNMPATRLVYRKLEALIDLLVRAGFELETAWHTLSTLQIYCRGFIVIERTRQANQTPPPGLLQLPLIEPEAMPHLAKLINERSIMLDQTGEASFDFGLNHMLDRAEQVLEQEKTAKKA
jgi:AcrR family transcriptional regulator